MGTFKHALIWAAVIAVACTWLIGCTTRALGLRHSGGHVLAETAALFVVAVVGALAMAARRKGGA
jgi:hypothetical protein